MNKIELFDNGNNDKFLLNVDSHAFCMLVQNAALQIIDKCHPHSPNFVAQIDKYEATVGERTFEYEADKFLNLLKTLYRNEITGQTVYSSLHLGAFEYVMTYVDLLNKTCGKYMVGDSRALRQIVYTAVHAFHYWKVKVIERSIEKNGYHMGSALGFYKIDYTERVADWEEKFELSPPGFPVLTLPCKRPDFEENLRKESEERFGEKTQ